MLSKQSPLRSNTAIYIALAAILSAGLLYVFNPWASQPLDFSYSPQGEIELLSSAGNSATIIETDSAEVQSPSTSGAITQVVNPNSPQIAALEAQLTELKPAGSNTELKQLITETDDLIQRTNAQLLAAGIEPALESITTESLQQRLEQLNPPYATDGAPAPVYVPPTAALPRSK